MTNRAIDLLPLALQDQTCARVERSSVTPYGELTRLDSIYGVLPKMVLGELARLS